MSQVQKWLPKAEGKERRLKAIAVIQAGHTGGEKSFTVGVCVCVWWWGGVMRGMTHKNKAMCDQ